MTFTEAMIEATKEAAQSGHECFVKERRGRLIISHDYAKDWLFRAYPGGRRILSPAGRDYVNLANGVTAAPKDSQ